MLCHLHLRLSNISYIVTPASLIPWCLVPGSSARRLRARRCAHVLVLGSRFIGTTVESSSLRSLLLSMCDQIRHVYGLSALQLKSEATVELKMVVAYFQLVVKRAAASRVGKIKPLVIMLDSLDQLSHDGQPQGELSHDGQPQGEPSHDGQPQGELSHDDQPQGELSHDGQPQGGMTILTRRRQDSMCQSSQCIDAANFISVKNVCSFIATVAEEYEYIVQATCLSSTWHACSASFAALKWIPKELPENVYFIVSTLPDSADYQYGYLPKLQAMFEKHKKTRFLEVPVIPDQDALATVNSWLESNGRSLTAAQLQVVMTAYSSCQLPLFLKLCFDEACKWASFTDVSNTLHYSRM